MSLKKCKFIYTEWKGRKVVTPVFIEKDIIINNNGCKVHSFINGVFKIIIFFKWKKITCQKNFLNLIQILI